ncbi:unnamed protein product [Rhodiola kirilowii]
MKEPGELKHFLGLEVATTKEGIFFVRRSMPMTYSLSME